MVSRIHPVDKSVGLRIRLLRTQKGVAQTKLAEALGLTFQQIQKYEQGVNRVSASKLYQIANVLDVDVAYFFSDLARMSTGETEDGLDLSALTQLDLSILRRLLAMKNTRIKRHLLNLLVAFADADKDARS